MENVDKKMNSSTLRIGVFDSGIGGLSVLAELFKTTPQAEYFYFSDDAFAPYGPKNDEFILDRSRAIVQELLKKNVQMIVIACNTATAVAIDSLRIEFPKLQFVGVEPYLNAIYKEKGPSKMAVLTTISTGKSQRFKRLKERLDPQGLIDLYQLANLAKMIEDLYHKGLSYNDFLVQLESELMPLKNKGYTHAILGCTHYPLVREDIEKILKLTTLSPCPYVANRVKELANEASFDTEFNTDEFEFISSSNNLWQTKKRKNYINLIEK